MQALLLSMGSPSPGETFNLVDDDCTGRSAAMAYAAQLLNVQPRINSDDSESVGSAGASSSAPSAAATPPAASAAVTPRAGGGCMDTPMGPTAQAGTLAAGAAGAGGSGRGEKRVSNAKAKRLLGWEMTYPSYREGLAAIAAQDRR